jgi:hypothetical protein
VEPGTLKGVGQAHGTGLGAVEQSGGPPEVNVPPNTGEGEPLLDSAPSRPTMSRQDVYARPMRAGRPLTNGPLTRLATWLKMTLSSGVSDRSTLEQGTLVLNHAPTGRHAGNRDVIEANFRRHAVETSATIPYDDRLRVMLDTGTYSLSALRLGTRVPVKELGAAIAYKRV